MSTQMCSSTNSPWKSVDVLAFRVQSLGSLYEVTNACGRLLQQKGEDLEILDFCSLNNWGLITSPQFMDICAQEIFDASVFVEVDRWNYIPSLKGEVLQAFFSMKNPTARDFLLTIEADFIGELLPLAQKFLDLGLSIMDFRTLRSCSPLSYLVMTAPPRESLDQKNVAKKTLKSRDMSSPFHEGQKEQEDLEKNRQEQERLEREEKIQQEMKENIRREINLLNTYKVKFKWIDPLHEGFARFISP